MSMERQKIAVSTISAGWVVEGGGGRRDEKWGRRDEKRGRRDGLATVQLLHACCL